MWQVIFLGVLRNELKQGVLRNYDVLWGMGLSVIMFIHQIVHESYDVLDSVEVPLCDGRREKIIHV